MEDLPVKPNGGSTGVETISSMLGGFSNEGGVTNGRSIGLELSPGLGASKGLSADLKSGVGNKFGNCVGIASFATLLFSA